MTEEEHLIELAINARKGAYTPYSKYKVGAALITKSGEIYTGFNIECAAYSISTCAERTALLGAVSKGDTKFKAIAIVGGPINATEKFSDYAPPCGVCRQYLREFCNPKKFKVILAKNLSYYKICTLEELLPMSFGPNNLEEKNIYG